MIGGAGVSRSSFSPEPGGIVMARACGVLVLAALLAAAAAAAPAPLPKLSAPPTAAQLQHRLRARGIAVEAIRRGARPDEWVIEMKVSVVWGAQGVERRIVKTVKAGGADERAALHALLASGQDALALHDEHERQMLESWGWGW
jgi:hypothetical protein